MRAISAAELLTAWERCLDAPDVLRGATLLAAATPQTAGDTAGWPIASRDAGLFRMRAQLFGNLIEGVALCPQCGETAEVEFMLDRVLDSRPPRVGRSRSKVFRIDGLKLRYRAPSSKDLVTISAMRDPELAKRKLMERCIELVEPQAEVAGRISEKIARSASEWITHDQSWADVILDLKCPACENAWQALFDIASFFWREVDAWARKILREIHTIAGRYGWNEADILAMSASRRQLYLEMLDQ